MTEALNENEAAVGRSDSNAGLGLPRFCTVKDMNWTGEIMHGKFDGTWYVLDDGDCYLPETLAHLYGAIFSDDDPRVPNDKVSARPLLGGAP
jgi:hypothetical protein